MPKYGQEIERLSDNCCLPTLYALIMSELELQQLVKYLCGLPGAPASGTEVFGSPIFNSKLFN
jgi:hypothetical protein